MFFSRIFIPLLGHPRLMKKRIGIFHEIYKVFVWRRQTYEAPGDIMAGRFPWVRYDNPDTKEFKLNVERNNGRAAIFVSIRVGSAIISNRLISNSNPRLGKRL